MTGYDPMGYYSLMPRLQKVVSVKLYPQEIEALEIIAKLAGWDGKSTAVREFMKIWVECAVVAIEKESATKSYMKLLKEMIRIHDQMETITKNAKKSKTENALHQHDLGVLKQALAI